MSDTGPAPAGWYPDATHLGQLRYWDGTTWTDNWAPVPPSAPPPPTTAYGAPPPPPPTMGYGAAPGIPPPSGTSGCLKAVLIVLALLAVGAVLLVVGLFVIGNRVVHRLNTDVNGTPGRPSSLPSGASNYAGERKQDHVASADGVVVIGSLRAVATDWSRATSGDANQICGDVAVQRAPVATNNPFDAALRIAGDFSWRLLPPTGESVSDDPSSSSMSSLDDYLTTGQAGDATGKICFDDPGGSGQFAITWQPRLLRPERAVWLVKLP